MTRQGMEHGAVCAKRSDGGRFVAMLLCMGLVPSLTNAAVQYDYVAVTHAPHVAKEGKVKVGSLVWQCAGNRCTIRGPWPTPSVQACRSLAREVGTITRYGHSSSLLSKQQLKQCNEGAKTELTARDRLVTKDDFKTIAQPTPGTVVGRPQVLPGKKPSSSVTDVQQSGVVLKPDRMIRSDLSIESVRRSGKESAAVPRVGDRVLVQVRVRNRGSIAASVLVVTTGNRPVLTKSAVRRIALGATVEVPLEVYVNPQHVDGRKFKTYVWLGTEREPLVYRDDNRGNNTHVVTWEVAPRPRPTRTSPGWSPGGGSARSGSSSSCDPAMVGTPCRIQPRECTGRGAGWEVNGTYQCRSGTLRCVAVAGEDYCNTCGGNCGACANSSCSEANLCAPGTSCVSNPALSPRPACRNLNDDFVARRTGVPVCTHIQNFCWSPDEVGMETLICREAQ